MKYYKNNLELIKKYRKELYEGIITIDEERVKSIDSVVVQESKDGHSILNIKQNSKNYRLNSSYYPVSEAEIWIKQFNFKHFYKVISLFGFSNGLFVQQIIKKMNQDDVLIVYEPSIDIFIKVLEEYDLKDIIENKKVVLTVVGINEKLFADTIRDNVEWLNLYSQIICCCPQYEHLFKDSYRDFLRIIRDNNNRAVVNRNTEAFLGEANSSNVIKNLKYLGKSNMATDLYGLIPNDIPAIIVAAGPSLDKNVQQLKNAKGKAVIISTDTAVNRLLAHDIIPDFTITLDPSKPEKYYVDERTKYIPLFYHMPSNNEIVSKHLGRKFVYNRNVYVSQLLKETGKNAWFNATGGSVATAAFSVCISIGFKRIIMVGQDLAFSGNVTHAGGVTGSDQQLKQEMVMVESIHGDMIPSPWNFYTFLLWFNDAIAVCKDVDVIDATEGGAKITGASIMDLQDAINKYCKTELNMPRIIDELEPTFNSVEIKKLYSYLQQSIDELDITINKSKHVISNLKKLIKLDNIDDFADKKNNLVKKISNNEKWIEKRMVYHLLEPYISMELTKALNQITHIAEDEYNNDSVKVYRKAIDTYNAIIKGAVEIKPLIEDTLLKYKNKENKL